MFRALLSLVALLISVLIYQHPGFVSSLLLRKNVPEVNNQATLILMASVAPAFNPQESFSKY